MTAPALPDDPQATPGPRLSPVPPPVADLVVEGEVDAEEAERLRALLDDAVAPGRRLVLDTSGVEHLSAAALGVLVGAHSRLRDGGGALVLLDPSPCVVRVLRVSGLHRELQVQARAPEGEQA